MKPEGLLQWTKEPATGPYPETDESSSRRNILFYLRSILTLSSHLRLCVPSGLLQSGFLTNFSHNTIKHVHMFGAAITPYSMVQNII
jgi:hypothetical protein